jgi:hypothetical protein
MKKNLYFLVFFAFGLISSASAQQSKKAEPTLRTVQDKIRSLEIKLYEGNITTDQFIEAVAKVKKSLPKEKITETNVTLAEKKRQLIERYENKSISEAEFKQESDKIRKALTNLAPNQILTGQ